MIQHAGVYRFWPVFLALVPIPATANAGVGFFTLPWPVVFLALIPVIVLEGFVLALILRLPVRRAFPLSLVANLRSTLYGLGLSYGLDMVLLYGTGSSGFEPAKDVVILTLMPLFVLSWWIEQRVVRRRASEWSKAAAIGAVGVANILSYGAMIAYIQLTPFIPEIAPSYSTRAILDEGFKAAQELKPRVEEFWAVHRRFPANAGELGNAGEPHDTSRFVVRLEADGRIVVRFHAPHHRHLDGKQIQLTPTPPVAPDRGRMEWRCRSPDLHPELLARLRAPCFPE